MKQKIDIAMQHFWSTRNLQEKAHIDKYSTRLGNGAAVSANNHLNTLTRVIVNSIRNKDLDIYTDKKNTGVPGRYRPLKNWDIVVKKNNDIVAAIELKSMAGDSFGKNVNSRVEEAVGSSIDLLSSYRSGVLKTKPWTGYVFVMKENDESTRPVSFDDQGIDGEFAEKSYIDRLGIMANRMVEDGLYDASWILTTSEPPRFAWSEINESLGHKNFIDLLNNHLSSII